MGEKQSSSINDVWSTIPGKGGRKGERENERRVAIHGRKGVVVGWVVERRAKNRQTEKQNSDGHEIFNGTIGKGGKGRGGNV